VLTQVQPSCQLDHPVVREKGLEPLPTVWKTAVLPLHHARVRPPYPCEASGERKRQELNLQALRSNAFETFPVATSGCASVSSEGWSRTSRERG
jgi:hypothetical protein